jgi:S-adenosylmethionine synthetase
LEAISADHFLFASESVGEGHPDKLCDQLSDAIVDAYLSQDPDTKISCDLTAKSNLIVAFGEIRSKANINIEQVIRHTIRDIGYNSKEKGLDWEKCDVILSVDVQKSEETKEEKYEDNQGIVFGYATDEWDKEILLPLTHYLATQLCLKLTELRRNKELTWLRPDCKAQVSIEYSKDKDNVIKPLRVFNVLVSPQHEKFISQEDIKRIVIEKVIKKVIPAELLDEKTIYYINPSGSFNTGGPTADAGLTGRKIIVDTYGGWVPHGGSAFSGKDPSKVKRCAGYYCRYVAKSLVANGLCHRVKVQVSYMSGSDYPKSIFVDSLGTAKEGLNDHKLLQIVLKNFDFTISSMIKELNLKRPIYRKVAASCHFGRNDPDFTWEQPKKDLTL